MPLVIYPSSADTVGVFDSAFNQQFPNARPLLAEIREPKRNMEHPLEKGQIISDYAVILPPEVEIPFMVAPEFARDTYQQIKSLFLNSTLLYVQTVAELYQNMIVAELPHQESPHYFNSIRVPVRFKQVQLVQSQLNFAPADPLNSNTQNLGVQNPASVSAVATATGVQLAPVDVKSNPLAASTSGAISNIPSSINANSLINPTQPSGNFSLGGVATVGGADAISAAFQ